MPRLTCKTAYAKPDTTNKTSKFSPELKLKYGGFVSNRGDNRGHCLLITLMLIYPVKTLL
jgi:hypothetical protein